MPDYPKRIKAGSRCSPLAQVQVEEIKRLLKRKRVKCELILKTYDTKGDRDRKTPLTEELPENFFTDRLDQALLKKEIDIAIHSAKDLPQPMPEGLNIFALTKAVDETDAFIGKTSFKKLKKGAKIGTSSPLRQQMVKKLNPKLKPAHIRGNIESRLRQLEEGKYDGIITATCALKRLGMKKLITDIMPWEATPLQGQLAVVGREKDRRLKELFAPIDVRRKYGRVYLLGAGPGDAGLFSVKGTEVLKKSGVVFYDFLINKELLKYAKRAEKIYVGKRKGRHSLPQNKLNTMIRDKARAGKTVVRLKGGDPLIFGRGADEIDYLRQYHIEVEVIPGISSATGIPSVLGIPLTARGISDSVAFVSGHRRGEGGAQRAASLRIPDCETLIFLMGLTKLKEIVRSLKKQGWRKETPVMIVSKGTCPDEKIVLGSLKDIVKKAQNKSLEAPALIIAGETVRFYREKTMPKKRVLYTGTSPKHYAHHGHLLHFPMIDIKKKKLAAKKKNEFIKEFKKADIVLLTSRFAVRYMFELLKEKRVGKKDWQEKVYVVIGQATAGALLKKGTSPALIAMEESSRGLYKEMKRTIHLQGKRIVFPRSALPNPTLKKLLRKEGAIVKEFKIYENVKPKKKKLPRARIDEVIFTSPSTVKHFIKDHGLIPKRWKVKARGPLTKEHLKKEGYRSEVI